MVYLKVLGQPHLHFNGNRVRLRPQEAALLSYLAEHSPRSFTRQFLAEQLWPRKNAEQSSHSLSQLLYQIRKKSARLPLAFSTRTVALGTISGDLAELRAYVRTEQFALALALVDGPYLDGELPGGAALSAWHDSIQNEVNGLVETCIRGIIADGGSDALWSEVCRVCNVLIGIQGPSKVPLEGLLLFYLRNGDKHRADSLYSELATVDEDQLPRSAYEALAVPGYGSNDSELRTGLRFTGRSEELARLQQQWSKAQAGNGQLVILAGEPGIGKSRVADQLLRRVAIRGGRVWSVSCHSAKRRIPYSGVADLLRENLATRSDLDSEARSLVELFRAASADDVSASLRFDLASYQLLNRVLDAISRYQKDDVLAVLIDDVQWADEFTARLLVLWALRVPASRVMLILTLRTHDAEPPPDWIVHELPGELIRLGPLSGDAANELVSSFEDANGIVFPGELRDKMLWQSAGRPLLLLEALKAAARCRDDSGQFGDAAQLSESAETFLRRRFAKLSREAHWVVGILAVINQALRPVAVAAISGLADSSAAAALEELGARGIVDVSQNRVAFAHDLMRETAYRQLPDATRALLHRRVADHLSTEGAHEGVLAQHFAGGGDSDQVGVYGLKAANEARQANLFADAEYYYKLVVEHGTSDHRAQAALALSRHLAQTGRTAEIGPLLSIVADADHSAEVLLLRKLYELESALSSGAAPVALLLDHARAVIEVAEALRSADLVLALGAVIDIAFEGGGGSLANETAEALEAAALRSTDPLFKTQVRALLSPWLGATAGYDVAMRQLDTIDTDSYAQASALTLPQVRFAQGTIALLAGSLNQARSALSQSLEYAQAAGDFRRQWAAHANLGLVYLESGEFALSRMHFEAALAAPSSSYRLRALTNLAILNYESGEYDLVSRAIRQAARSVGPASPGRTSVTADAVLGLTFLRMERIADAQKQLDRISRSCGTDPTPGGDIGYTLQLAALLLARSSHIDSALALLDDGIDKAEKLDRISSLRLRSVKAEVLQSRSIDQAYATARLVEQEASSIGAAAVAARAARIAAATRV